ncbi:hypothetical protein CGZ91_00140 [Parenemella sanctibonifatiensis]|uniref:Probable queuosine precursor transporter n=1 Tax=Parenemella sanctibonifatiensis TaxID=2016505 RepID=A0A255ELX0_9ACTN|nr:hypothetical protein CGZ91_00140 [Parenemella sanctibonifatiensis]
MLVSTTTSAVTAPAYAKRGTGHYDLLVVGVCVVIILSNIGASKGVQIGPLVTDGGFFLFPLAYILGDVISEVYGPKAARRSIILGFSAALFAVLTFWAIIALPGFTDDYGLAKQEALEVALGPVWQIVAASLAGFAVGQGLNAWVMASMKRRTQEKHLVARIMGSTGVGEFADTVVFCAIAATAIGISGWGQFANYVIVGFLWKTLVEFLMVPVTAKVIGVMKRHEPSYQEALARTES